MNSLRFSLSLITVAIALGALTACNTATVPAVPTPKGPKYAATVRIESAAARGAGVKVNGTLVATQLPADVAFEVTEAGRTVRAYTISLNRNIIAGSEGNSPNSLAARPGMNIEAGSITIDVDQTMPARINFDSSGPLITGSAVIDQVR